MKTKKYLLIAFLALSRVIISQIVPTNGLVASWEFNNNFNDGLVVNPASASPQPPTFTYDRCGNYNKAVHFNGNGQYLETILPVGSNLTGNNPRSLSFWMRTTVTTGPNAIFAYGNSNSNSGTFEINNNYCQQGVGLDISQSASTTAKSCVNDGNWHHVVVVYSGNFYATQYYFDGILYTGTLCGNGLNQPDPSAINTIAGPMRFGCNALPSPFRFFTGDLDDFYLYDRVLSQPEVTGLYGMSCGISAPPCFCNEQNTFTAPNFGPNSTYVWWYTGSGILNITSGQGTNIVTAAATGGPAGTMHCYITSSCGGHMQLDYSFNYCNTSQITTLSAPNVTLCTNNATSVLLSASATGAGPYTYVWTPGNWNGPTYNVSPSSTTNFMVTATSKNACPATANVLVTVQNNCCQQSSNSANTILPSTINGYGTWGGGGTFIGINNINITSNTSFSGEFLMAANAKIIVNQGVNLDLSSAHIYACGTNMWDGIEVRDGGSISTSFPAGGGGLSSLIEDAKIAIDLSNISTNRAPMPIALDEVTFNKNYIGIKIANGLLPLVNLPVHLLGCVFTSRAIPFTSTSWPLTSILRSTTSTQLAGLASPCSVGGYPIQNLIAPFSNQTSLYGIQIDDIGQIQGQSTNSGVDIGLNPMGGPNDFNLFDNLGVGVKISNANFTSMNNIFQDMIYNTNISGMDGVGIEHLINGPAIMNARLDLRPVGSSNQTTAFGNRFWNCKTGIKTQDVLEVWVEYGTFRSTQKYGKNNTSLIGDQGIYLESNRFDYDISFNEFNNVKDGLVINNTNYSGSGMYDIGGIQVGQIYASKLDIEQNYFGACVNSNASLGTNYMSNAIQINGPNSNIYQIPSLTNYGTILSNKINRSFRGISLFSMYYYPIDISANDIFVIDETISPSNQFGISATENQGNLKITDNSVQSVNITNPLMSLIYCKDNQSTTQVLNSSPIVHCNYVSLGYNGFEFNGDNRFTSWMGNTMKTHQNGLVLSDNASTGGGIIGDQGSSSVASANVWLGTWTATGPYHTLCINSNATNSRLYLRTFVSNENPIFNSGGFISYIAWPSVNVIKSRIAYVCPPNTYPTPPSWRPTSNETGIVNNNLLNELSTKVYPNPSNGKVNFSSDLESELLNIKVCDVTGKVVFDNLMRTENHNVSINLPNDQSIYFVEVKNGNGASKHMKLIMTK